MSNIEGLANEAINQTKLVFNIELDNEKVMEDAVKIFNKEFDAETLKFVAEVTSDPRWVKYINTAIEVDKKIQELVLKMFCNNDPEVLQKFKKEHINLLHQEEEARKREKEGVDNLTNSLK